ncbi:thioredoxin family protein [Erythrobacter sp. SD-21]|uniref:thioredoxin family protein n=1 Tax=Erythrobacter sp. SD-21 TaxID=161528 RepID=UPI000153FE2D|nr:thioredoxin family protein [Erythrobacter sp. SD-21]EDL49193.1 Putative protein disulfide isomerase [Erythrobacter sp. SD-21]
MKRIAMALAAALSLAACAMSAPRTAGDHHPEARAYDTSRDATTEVDAALERALANGKKVMLVMGANWWHDSRALAGLFETPRFAELLEREYELVFVNVGMPQTGDGHNLDIAARFGLEDLPGTPNVLVLSPFGTLLNAKTATSWRNAASRSEDAIYEELAALAG